MMRPFTSVVLLPHNELWLLKSPRTSRYFGVAYSGMMALRVSMSNEALKKEFTHRSSKQLWIII